MNLDRRAFLAVAVSAAAGATLSSCASIASVPVVPSGGAVRLRIEHHPALIEPHGALRLALPDDAGQIYVLALGVGEFAALSPICTHLGCTVGVSGTHLVCPCHGSTYDRNGRVLRGPAERALRSFPTRVTTDGHLVIQVDGAR